MNLLVSTIHPRPRPCPPYHNRANRCFLEKEHKGDQLTAKYAKYTKVGSTIMFAPSATPDFQVCVQHSGIVGDSPFA